MLQLPLLRACTIAALLLLRRAAAAAQVLEPVAGKEVPGSPGLLQIDVLVADAQGSEDVFRFTLAKKELGSKKGCWMTKSLARDAVH